MTSKEIKQKLEFKELQIKNAEGLVKVGLNQIEIDTAKLQKHKGRALWKKITFGILSLGVYSVINLYHSERLKADLSLSEERHHAFVEGLELLKYEKYNLEKELTKIKKEERQAKKETKDSESEKVK